VRSNARRNQLNLPHGTKTKPDMLKGEQPESVESVREKERGPVVGREEFVKEVGFELGVKE